MKKHNIVFELVVFDSIDELLFEDQKLMLAAVEARKNAYAPYSNFQVGAALLLDNDEVVLGNNQENACYPAGLCAERVAIFHAGANFSKEAIKAIAISATSLTAIVDKPAAPCGSCRQAISEYEIKQKKPIKILMMGAVGEVLECKSIADLLPLAFNSSYLD